MSAKCRSLYIHIPFCLKKCPYCAFVSSNQAPDIQNKYIIAVLKEMAEKSQFFIPIKTVYFGGGTPSLLDPSMIQALAEGIRRYFKVEEDAEWTIEVNPNSADLEKLKAYRDLGFNRLSIGIQSLSPELLKTLGRLHSREEALACLENAGRAGFTNISCDIMFGLPGQRPEDLEEDLKTLLAYPQVRHLSCYSLSIEPGTAFDRVYQAGKLVLPDEASERAMKYTIDRVLDEHGFIHYEISNYALPGFSSQHNTSYWDLTDYYGFGLSASGYLDGVRYTNTDQLDAYLFASGQEGREEHALSQEEAMGDFMFLGLRMLDGVRDTAFQKSFQASFFDVYRDEIEDLIARGLLVRDGDILKLTSLGEDLANQVFIAFV